MAISFALVNASMSVGSVQGAVGCEASDRLLPKVFEHAQNLPQANSFFIGFVSLGIEVTCMNHT